MVSVDVHSEDMNPYIYGYRWTPPSVRNSKLLVNGPCQIITQI